MHAIRVALLVSLALSATACPAKDEDGSPAGDTALPSFGADTAAGSPDAPGATQDTASDDAGGGSDGGPDGGPDGSPAPDTAAADTATPDATATDDATIEQASFPATIPCGGAAEASVTVRNTGTTTWTRAAGYRLGAVGDEDPLYTLDVRVNLPDDAAVPPGGAWTFPIPLSGPPTAGAWPTDWRMVREGVHWFGGTWAGTVETTCTRRVPTGGVDLQGRSLVDAGGPFNALGATLFWAAWAYKHDKPKLEAALAWLAAHDFEAIRALGLVGDPNGPDYWDGREIVRTWPDYAEVIAGVTDLAFGTYGLRVEWTLIGDGQVSVPEEADRYALVDTFLAMSEGREDAILMFEIANEAWQNGFPGEEGREQLRALTAYMNERTDILVAASAPDGHECADAEALYAGGIADIATIHFDRDTGKVDGHWRPVRQPWEHQFCDLPVGSNNEPIGPGASVASEDDPLKLVMAAVVTHVAGLPIYVFHTSAGVRGDVALWDMAGGDAFAHLDALVPGDLASWDPQNCHWEGSPWVCFAGDGGGLHPDTMWPDLDGPTSGAVRVYSATRDGQFVSAAIGILDHVTLEARAALSVEVVHPLTGAVLESRTLQAGESFDLKGADGLVLRGSFL